MILSLRLSFGVLVAFVVSLLLIVPAVVHGVTVQVTINKSSFSPPTIAIMAGDSVIWRNESSEPHTVTSANGLFTSNTLRRNENYSLTFNTAGTYSYYSKASTGMTGSIIVYSNTGGGYTSGQPTYTYPYTYTPSSVPPSSSEQLRAQAEALLARVRELQAKLGTASGNAYAPGTGTDSSSCPLIGVVLRPGSSGEDVSRLQAFLARDPSVYPEAIVNGYYGPLTEAAVRRWQTKYNIVSSGTPGTNGFGQVGPRTAAAIALLCTTGSYGGIPGPSGGSPNVGGFIQVTPISGDAPLSISVQTTVNTVNSCGGATYTLDYGDGEAPSQIAVPPGACTQATYTFRHTYEYGGTYLVTLASGGHRTTATVQVSGSSRPTTPAASPASWGIVTVTPAVEDDPFTVSVEIEYPACEEYSMDWGDGGAREEVTPPANCSKGQGSDTFTHTYAEGGAYTITLRDEDGDTRATAGVTII